MTKIMAPAGDLEKLKYAVLYGADVVYLGGTNFGMRANAGNFTLDEIKEGVEFAHAHHAEVNVTVNIMARSGDIEPILDYVGELQKLKVDGVIVADTGVIGAICEKYPDMFISLSTQASTTNAASVRFWEKNGVRRIVLARELSFAEVAEICRNKGDMQIEVFAHGSMCISYSGRCLLSNYLAGRDANRGDCAQPCRWKYALVEEKRPGQYFPVEEDASGTFFFNSKDLCLIAHIPELIACGVDSLKIEGRMKSIFYVATVTNAYKIALSRAEHSLKTGEPYVYDDLYDELCKISHRGYTEGFFFGNADGSAQNYKSSSYIRDYTFAAEVLEDTDENQITKISQRNKFALGDELEVLHPGGAGGKFVLTYLRDEAGEDRTDAPHPVETLYIKSDGLKLCRGDLLRRKS